MSNTLNYFNPSKNTPYNIYKIYRNSLFINSFFKKISKFMKIVHNDRKGLSQNKFTSYVKSK